MIDKSYYRHFVDILCIKDEFIKGNLHDDGKDTEIMEICLIEYGSAEKNPCYIRVVGADFTFTFDPKYGELTRESDRVFRIKLRTGRGVSFIALTKPSKKII